MKNSILFNSSVKKETEKRVSDFVGWKQIIILSAAVIFVFLVMFYFFCFYFSPEVASYFSFSSFVIIYLAFHVTKFIILDFIVRPQLLKEKKSKLS